MGVDKALLTLDTENFLTVALQNARAVCATPVIVGDASRYGAYGVVVEDRFRACGPLGGIHTALCSTTTEWNLMLSVDLPLMKAEFLRWLAGVASSSDEMAIVPRVNGRIEPLCACYRRAMWPLVQSALEAGRYKIEAIFSEAPTRLVTDDEIRAAGFGGEIFRNVNTPEDYEWVKRHFAGKGTVEARG